VASEKSFEPAISNRGEIMSSVSHLLILLLISQSPYAPPKPPTAEEIAKANQAEAVHLKNIRQVTFGFAKAGEGYFSPDGRSIIFQAALPGQEDYQIYTQELKPGAKPVLVSTGKGKCTCSYFHPTQKMILFGSTHLDPTLSEAGPGKEKQAAKKGPAYSRSERYRWDFDPAMDIFTANPDGSNLHRLTDTPGYDAEGSWSPDGKQIIFTSFRDGNAEIYIMDADGKNARRITHAKGYDGGPFFSPDGKKIIYRSDRKENDLLQIYINTPDGTHERALTNNDSVNWGPFFWKDSRHIVYSTSVHGHSNYEVYWMDTETGKQTRITFREGFDGLPVFNADGTKMMWTSKGRNPDNTSQLFIADFVPPQD
jgi:Tol biopolymer transport system component